MILDDYCFLTPDDARWQQFLNESPHDFYHFPKYVTLCGNHQCGKPLAFFSVLGNQKLLLPLLLQEFHPPNSSTGMILDATCAYGYPCPLFNNSDVDSFAAKEFLTRSFASMLRLLNDIGVVSAFFRLHPLFKAPLDLLQTYGTIIPHGETVYIDLSNSSDEMWQQTRSGHRNEINRLKRKGHKVEFDSDWSQLDEFIKAYSENMRRIGADDNYFFPKTYFEELRRALGSRIHLCTVSIDNQIACAGIFTESCGIVQYHLSGTKDAFYKQYPTKLMLDFVRNWAKERGNKFFHLGGGLGAQEDSLFYFKSGFSDLRSTFYTWRIIVNELAYQKEVASWEEMSKCVADSCAGYFPAYRKKLLVKI